MPIRMNHRALVAAAGGSAVITLIAGQAIAAPAWGPVHVFAPPGRAGAFGPLVVANDRGDAAVVWVDRASGRVRVAQRPAGHGWRSAATVSPPKLAAEDEQVAIDPRGDEVAVWDAFDGQHELMQAATRRAGHGWGDPATLGSLAPGNPARPQVAIDAEGAATVVWRSGAGAAGRIQMVHRTAAGHWGRKVRLPESGPSTVDPDIAVDAKGNAVVAWQRILGTGTAAIQVTRHRLGRPWSVPHTVSTESDDSEGVQVASDARGDAVVIWRSCSADASTCGVQAARRPAGGGWHSPATLSATGQNTIDPHLALDARGDAMVTWDRVLEGVSEGVEMARHGARGAWHGPVLLDGAGWSSAVALDARGDAVVTFQITGDPDQIDTMRRPHDGSWSAPVRLSTARATGSSVASDARGDAIAVWQQTSSDQTQIAARIRPAQ